MVSCSLILPLLLCTTQASDRVQDPDLRQAIASYQGMDYQAALDALEEIEARDELEPGERIVALAYLARAYAVYRRHELAVRTFERVLVLSPGFEVSELESSLIQQAAAEARLQVAVAVSPDRAPPTEDAASTEGRIPAASVPTAAPQEVDVSPPPVAEPNTDGGESGFPFGIVVGVGIAGGLLVVGGVGAVVAVLATASPWGAPTLGRWELP